MTGFQAFALEHHERLRLLPSAKHADVDASCATLAEVDPDSPSYDADEHLWESVLSKLIG